MTTFTDFVARNRINDLKWYRITDLILAGMWGVISPFSLFKFPDLILFLIFVILGISIHMRLLFWVFSYRERKGLTDGKKALE